MASRMERYHKNEGRSSRNENLYKSIENLDNYSNIEGVIAIDKTNEIDITKVKKMIQSREGYQKNKQYRQIIPEEEVEEENVFEEETEDRTYDIRDVLTKAKETRTESDDKYRTLKNVNYDVIKKLNLKTSPEEEGVLKELVDTMTMHTQAMEKTRTKKENPDDALGLLDDIKADTKLEESASIKKLIEEAREEQKEQENKEEEEVSANLENLDKSFYTSSLGFTDSDFEDLKNLGEDIKKHNGLIKTLIIILIIVAIIIAVFIGFQFLNK